MAYVRQGVTVTKKKGSGIEIPNNSSLLIAVKKTGYYNFSIDGKTYYYDERINTSTINQEVLLLAFGGGKAATQKKKKGQITVTKK